ncbi:redoxin domain-containing protein [Alkalibacillus haloalkaliphilus]|uniref:redoxin domain-containing protein n=1 Tax=Alkalibacillus haloalkaliphilus TaxID=94136 RepID=UPI00293576CC|nr:redoxin domain-containing protein [Alkalibacillus haloalkaliphilus]MDV2580729.1 redoxin domain-containing protein [Alkalibacillus haloalkaliphilus]
MYKVVGRIGGVLLIGLLVWLIINDHIINQEEVEIDLENRMNPDFNEEVAPNFTLNTINGDNITLDDLRGQAVLVNFWASWCQPCLNEMPAIQSIYNTYGDSGLEVLAVNIGESRNTVEDFRTQFPELEFHLLLEDDIVADQYMIINLPTTYFINPDGTIEAHYRGELSEEQLAVLVEEILPEG